jgi:hypothetical protein
VDGSEVVRFVVAVVVVVLWRRSSSSSMAAKQSGKLAGSIARAGKKINQESADTRSAK